MSSKYVRYDRIFPSRKSATVTPANWTCRPVASSTAILAEDERPRVIGFDEPFGERLIAHFVESPEHDDDVGERFLTEGREVSECRQPRHRGVRRPANDVVGEQGIQIHRCVTDLGLERLRQHVLREPLIQLLFLPGIDLSNIFGNPASSGPQGLRLGRRELLVGERARGVQLREVLELVGRVRRRRCVLHLVLVFVGWRLVVSLLSPALVAMW